MEPKTHLKTAKIIAHILDDQFSIGGIKFGLDPIINIIPWIGDAIGVFMSFYILYIGKKMNVGSLDMAKMIGNIIIDFIVGIIPFIGVIFDIAYKANIRNLRILEKYSHGKFIEGQIIS